MVKNFLDTDKSLACIHCGLCLGSCPTYLETGNENDSPRGRIYIMRALQDGRMPLSDVAVKHLDLCLGCRACEPACPSGVQYGSLLEATREYIEKNFSRPPFQKLLRRIAIERVFPFPRRMKWLLRGTALARGLKADKWLPKFARDGLALLPENPESHFLPEFSAATTNDKSGQVGFIQGCVMPLLFGATNQASVRVLNALGYDVITPGQQVCCGALYAHGGNLEAAREVARKNIAAFDGHNLQAVIINAAGCGSTLKDYGHLMEQDPEWASRARDFASKVKDLTEILPIETATSPWVKFTESHTVTYHDACHLAHAQRITQPPRLILKQMVGNRFVELPESDVCCGSAGSYNLTEPEMAARLQKRKIENILKTGATVVITTNPGCILQIQAGLKAAGAEHIKVMHLADFIWKHAGGL